MFDSLMLGLALALPNDQPHQPQHSNVTADAGDQSAREFSAARPNRGVHRSVVIDAATFPSEMRTCASRILARESGGTLDDRTSGMGARNPSSSASGRWQFLDNSWRRPLSFHVRDRLIEFGMPKHDAVAVRAYLEGVPIYVWPGVIQDVAFIETVERGGYSPWGGCP